MFEAHRQLDPDGSIWTYLPYGPFPNPDEYLAHLQVQANCSDPLCFAIVSNISNEALGVAAYLRNEPTNGVVEVGHLCFTPKLQRRPEATEAMYLMMRHPFEDLGYRRYEWKCNAGNVASIRAAQRYGFTFEGTFRQAMVSKGRNRDTAWFSILDSEWPTQKARFEAWLSTENFDETGQQIRRLQDC